MIVHSKPTIEKDDYDAVYEQLNTNFVSSGDRTKQLEYLLKTYFNVKHSKAYSSGKAALIGGLSLLNLSVNDEIIVPTYVCRAVYDAIKFLNLKPVIVDISDDYCINYKEIENNISSRTKAILVIHIYGITADLANILRVAREHNLYLIEDVAQAFGAEFDEEKLGSYGDIAFGSFHGTKVLTSGEGGFLLINNEVVHSYFSTNELSIDFGANFSDINAALAINQIGKIPGFIEKRKKLAERYIKLLQHPYLHLPLINYPTIFFRFPVRIKQSFNFEKLREALHGEGIQIRRGTDLMLHKLDKGNNCPNADAIFRENVSLPIYPDLSLKDIEFICARFMSNIKKI